MPPNTPEKMPTPPPPLDGELRFDEVTRKGRADDFGHIVHHMPEGVLLPGSADDVAKTIQWTAQRGGKFAPQGQRHSTFGRSQVPSGIVADMSTLRSIGAVEGDRVVVEAGTTWSDVLRATLARGKTPPVLTEYLELSVGGTLIVGGVGGTTSAFGVQSDNVIDMEVVTGEGKKVTCSASNNADLFNAVRAGLGQVGVIAKATLKLVPAPESVRRFLLVYPDLATMLRDERLLSADNRFDSVQGAIVAAPSGGLAFRLDAAKNFNGDPPDDNVLLAGLSDDSAQRQPTTIEFFDYLNRFAAFEATLRANGQWFFPHPWLMTFIGDSQVESVVNAELDALNPAMDLGPFGQVALVPIRRSAISSPLLRMPADDLCYAFNLVRIPATNDANEANRLVDANKATYGGSRLLAAPFTRSARSRCPRASGATTSARPSVSWTPPSSSTTRTRSSRPATRSSSAGAHRRRHEVPLAAYRLFAADDPLSRLVLEPVLAGVASRRPLRIGESVGVTVAAAATGTSRSAISRRFVAQTRTALAGGHLDRRGPVVSGEGVPAAEA